VNADQQAVHEIDQLTNIAESGSVDACSFKACRVSRATVDYAVRRPPGWMRAPR
jgi:hypothetical protein